MFSSGRLGFPDVEPPRFALAQRGFFALGNVDARPGPEAIAPHPYRHGSQAAQQLACIGAVRDKSPAVDVRKGFFHEPFRGIPGAGAAPARDALDAAAGADILDAKARELRIRPDLDMEEPAFARGT